jgi:glycosyltransferase involved in cell wall biosynthesis
VLHPEIEAFDEYHGGALARWTAEIARRAPRGVEVTVVGKPPRSAPYRGVPARLVPVRSSVLDRVPALRGRAIHWFFPEARRRLLERRYDVVHVHARPQWVEPLRRAGLSSRLFLHLQNHHLGTWSPREVSDLLGLVEGVVCCSDWLAGATREIAGGASAAEKVWRLHNGVDVRRFAPGADERTGPALSVVAVGRLVPEKSPHLAMEAVARLRREGRPLSMTLVGAHDFGRFDDTPYIRSLREIAASDPAGFRFTGYVHHRRLPDVLRRHDVYAHACTWHEPFGLTTAEAMACGLAPLVSDRGANPEVVGDPARVVEPTADAVADGLRRLLAPGEAAAAGRRARVRAADLFSWDRIASEYFARVL